LTAVTVRSKGFCWSVGKDSVAIDDSLTLPPFPGRLPTVVSYRKPGTAFSHPNRSAVCFLLSVVCCLLFAV
jgi:hypothetical protein